MKEYSVIIWGMGDTYNVIKFEEMKENIGIKLLPEKYLPFIVDCCQGSDL